jgi:hypothetical protein
MSGLETAGRDELEGADRSAGDVAPAAWHRQQIAEKLASRRPRITDIGRALRAAVRGGAPEVVSDAVRAIRASPSFVGKELPPEILTWAIRADLALRRPDAADALLAEAEALHPDARETWDKLGDASLRLRVRAAEAAMARGEVREAFAVQRGAPETAARHPARLMQLHEAVEDWLSVLRLGDALLGDGAQIEDLPPQIAQYIASARGRLGLHAQGLALLRTLRRQDPHDAGLRLREARWLANGGDATGAVMLLKPLWDEGVAGALPSLVSSLIQLHEYGLCARLLDEAAAQHDAAVRTSVGLARVGLLEAQGRRDEAAGLLLSMQSDLGEETFALRLAPLAAAMRRSDLLQALLRRVEGWLTEPGAQGALFRVGPVVLRSHLSCLLSMRALMPVIDALEGSLLPGSTARALVSLLDRQREHRRAAAVADRTLSMFPSDVRLWALYLSSLGALRDATDIHGARARLKATMPAAVAVDIMAGADSSTWNTDDLPAMLQHVLGAPQVRSQARFFASLRRAAVESDAVIRALRAATPPDGGIAAANLEFVTARAMEGAELERTVAAPASFEAFRRSRSERRARIDAACAGLLRQLRAGTTAEVQHARDAWLRDALESTRAIEARAATSWLHTADLFADAAELAAELVDRIRKGRPTSVLRIGDGEGQFLSDPGEPRERVAPDREAIQAIWWGSRRLDGGAEKRLEADLRGAIDRADILGVIPLWRFIQGGGRRAPGTASRGMLRVQRHVAAVLERRSRAVTSAHLHYDLHVWGLWPEILAAIPRLSWISCHDLGPFLWSTHGIATRQAVLIPPEHRFAPLFRQGDHPGAESETLLDRHEEICAALLPEPGEVYLVAAGVLGKLYCDIIRRRGGIGIDIGSLADYWMGFTTRAYKLGLGSNLSLPATLLTGHGLEAPLDRARILGRPGIVRSSRDGRCNVATAADELAAAERPRQRRRLRIIGHPRCASGFMATLFSAYGLEIGHEKLLADGISSWMGVVDDLNPPFGDNASVGIGFDHTVAHVRDPRDAIPSIILENGFGTSFHFRRQHILRATGEDIARHGTAAGRAVASFLRWHEMAMRLAPEAVFRVEEAAGPVRAWLAGWWRADLAEADDAQGIAGYNATEGARRFTLPKPVLTPADWDGLEPALREELAAFCAAQGYAPPWEPRPAR